MKERLNKFIASTGYCSRRKADILIKEGKVKVNGQKVSELGIKIDPSKDKVEVEGKILKPISKKVYYKLYKPRGYLTALGKDKFGRKTLTDLFKEINFKEKVFPVGRLDLDSEGLLILTNDGEFAYKLMHPSFKIPKKYILKVEGRINAKDFNKIKKGTKLEDTFLKPDSVKILKKDEKSTTVEIEIHSGQKRILRRFFKKFGYPVKRLLRIQIGNIKLGDLKEKEIKIIGEEEILKLKRRLRK
ncbi:pseudouridine synthase [Hydrogenothermus marinus]|uniref:Pseudouridine synthase n=1 Tax=Hydrogenothermus marinus TaxID=133270 RepID=A0A3M0B7P9_9AQUI|nr:pseudouridine synthase [Hydrogenothermus marinus]RMA92484.1 23S rRNA pseudouridine2605 synthase [Hydrogenothermus marinus]